MKINNDRIRKALKEKGLYFWNLADILGVSEPTITRWMRHEMPEDKQDQIIDAINRYERRS